MTSDELKKLLEARAIIDTPNICNSCYAEGFRNAFDIMWPLVEALEFYSDKNSYKKSDYGYFTDLQTLDVEHFTNSTRNVSFAGKLARQALTDLEQKLKGTE